MPTQIYSSFIRKIDKDLYQNAVAQLKENSSQLLEDLKDQLNNEYSYNLLSVKEKYIVVNFLGRYIKEILPQYPDMNVIKKIYFAGKKLTISGIPDILILNIYNRMKKNLNDKSLLNNIIEHRVDTDILAILRPYTLFSMDIEKRINSITTVDGISEIGVSIIERINKAKREHLQIKNKIIKSILDGDRKVSIKRANECEFYKIIADMKIDTLNKDGNYHTIKKVHQSFHDYASFYLLNKDNLTPPQKYLLIKEIESLSMKILFLLSEIQIEISNQLSFFDMLTNSYNKNIFPFVFQREVRRAKRYSFPISIIMMDIDNFKQINDRYGHLTGDDVLKELSRLIRRNTRQSDYFFRFGGEEFILILPHTDLDGALKTAEKIRKRVGSRTFTNQNLKITISCGIAQLKNFDNPYIDLEEADKMLYVSKNTGKNRCTVSRGET